MVACADPALLDEVIRYLEEIPHWRLVVSAHSCRELFQAVAAHRPDCVLVAGDLAPELAADPRGRTLAVRLVTLGRVESTEILRAALTLGASGFVVWPDDQSELRSIVERGMGNVWSGTAAAGPLFAVWAPKGGSGASVLAAHLAAALVPQRPECFLIDLDLDHADQSVILRAGPETKTISELLRVADEVSPAMVQSVAWAHPAGFRAILAPGLAGAAAACRSLEVDKVLRVVREVADPLVADLPSGDSDLVRALLSDASQVVLVLTPDVLSLRRARDAMRALASLGAAPERVVVVLNQAGGADITERDVKAVLGVSSVFRVRADFSIYRAANRGEIAAAGRRALLPLARRLSSGAAARPADSTNAVMPAVQDPPPARRAPTALEPVGHAGAHAPASRARAGLVRELVGPSGAAQEARKATKWRA
jgi:Flp pilus assembly CpaE family ATPase